MLIEPPSPPTNSTDLFVLEKYKADLAIWVDQNKSNLAELVRANWRQTDFVLGPGSTAVTQFALSGMRSLMLLNGGAIIALLSVFGNAISHDHNAGQFAKALTLPLCFFISGLFLGLVTTLLSYAAQVYFTERGHQDSGVKFAIRLRYGALGLALSSGILFAVGSFAAVNAFRAL